MKTYAKIVHDEGVVFEKQFASEAEAQAFVEGFYATLESLDVEDDSHFACVDEEPAKDES